MVKRDYDGALTYWLGIKSQIDGYAYWHNLGALQTLRGQYPEARYALSKARYLTLYSSATESNLEKVTKQLNVDLPTSSQSSGTLLTNALIFMGPLKLLFLAVISLLILIVFIKKNWSRGTKIALTILSIIPLCLVALIYLKSVAFITLKPIELYDGPSRVFAGGKAISAGTRILGWTDENWIKIHDDNGGAYWVSKNEIAMKAGWLWGDLQE